MKNQYIRLSRYLGVAKETLDSKGVHDRVIGNDTQLFFDPFLLPKIDIPEFNGAREKILNHFSKPIKLIKLGCLSKAAQFFNFKEFKGVGLGYGKGSENGSAVGKTLALKLVTTAKYLIDAGIEDPELIELIGLFQEGFGADRLSDISISILHSEIISYTSRVVSELKIKASILKKYQLGSGGEVILPVANGKPILFLPKYVLRQLPTADERENIDSIISTNQEIRSKFNALLGNDIHKWSKSTALNIFKDSPEAIQLLVDRYKNRDSEPYDIDSDSVGFERWIDDGFEFAESNPLVIDINPTTLEEVYETVKKIINKFQHGIEFNGWNKLLFDDMTCTKPRHENYAQLVFFIVAQSYCETNNLDLSPECNSGKGPIDFKLSRGISKVLVELKLTSNTSFISGIKKQLPLYQVAENSQIAIFLAIKTTTSDNQIKKLMELGLEERKQGRKLPEYCVVDATKKPSASKAR